MTPAFPGSPPASSLIWEERRSGFQYKIYQGRILVVQPDHCTPLISITVARGVRYYDLPSIRHSMWPVVSLPKTERILGRPKQIMLATTEFSYSWDVSSFQLRTVNKWRKTLLQVGFPRKQTLRWRFIVGGKQSWQRESWNVMQSQQKPQPVLSGVWSWGGPSELSWVRGVQAFIPPTSTRFWTARRKGLLGYVLTPVN